MKTLILNGSPRPKGDTAALLERLIPQLTGEVRRFDACRRAFSPCVDCRACRERAGCVLRDDMEEIYDYLPECDSVLIASPLWFSQLSGPLLSLCSRFQTYFSARRFRGEEPLPKKKRGGVLLVGGGTGQPERAYATAKIILREIGCRDIYPLLCSHRTDELPAGEDEAVIAALPGLAAFLEGRGENVP